MELKEMLNDKSFTESLVNAKDASTLESLFKTKGVELNDKDAEGLLDLFKRFKENKLTDKEKVALSLMSKNSKEELSENELELVAGGISIWGWIGLAAATVCSAGLAAVGVMAYDAYKIFTDPEYAANYDGL